jgi:hypothetical protein
MSQRQAKALNLDTTAFGNANLRSPRTTRSGRRLDSPTNTRSRTAPKSPSYAISGRAAPSRPESPTYAKSERAAQIVSGSLSRPNKRHKRSGLSPTTTFAGAADNKATFFNNLSANAPHNKQAPGNDHT